MRAYTHRFISFAVQCAVILLLAFGLSFSAERSLAQDTATDSAVPTDTATVLPTDVPTELPTVIPTDAPTEQATDVPTDIPPQQVTDVPTEAVTEQATAAPTDAAVTSAPTEASTEPATTPDPSKYFTENFQDGETSGWLLTAGWTLTDEAGNAVLAASTPNEVATLTAITWPYYSLSLRVRGAIQLTTASGGSNYQVKIGADGSAELYKDNILLGQSAGAPASDATIEPSLNWHTVNLLAPGNLFAVKVDSYAPISTSDATLVGMGPLMLNTSADNAASVAFDDVNIQKLDAPPPVPTAAPTASGVVPIPPPMNVTAEPTADVTAEATSEATQEATVEATVEATSEATAEATVEATVEATAEVNAESLGLSEAARSKLPAGLVSILDSYTAGDIEAAKAAAADYFITVDDQQRIDVTVWTTDEQAAAKLTGDITTAGGIVTDAFSIRVQASVTMDGLLALANAPEVTLIEVPPKAVSTSDMQAGAPAGYGTGSGTEISEGVDTSGATAWQKAGIKGSGVGVVVIDTGFGAGNIPISGEYACLGSGAVYNQIASASDTVHGLSMVQVICDMAPSASVYMYKAVNGSTLKDAIDLANTSAAVKVIVISMDLGASMSPGDGSGGGATYGTLNDLYTSIKTAHDNGKVIIASAGNNTGRYVTLNYSGAASTVPMTVFAGDTIHVSWNDWSSNTKNPAIQITGDLTLTLNAGGGTRPGAPRAFYTVPAGSCTTGCNINIGISGASAGLIIQVQVAGEGTINSAGVTGSPVVTTAGNLARPADSAYVIAAGAVCNNSNFLQKPGSALTIGSIQLRRDTYSSQGPAYATGGDLAATSASYIRDQVKPDLMGISHVSVAGNSVNLANPFTCDDQSSGFNGTSAAAASVGGMAALLLSNTTNSSMVTKFIDSATSKVKVDNVKEYLQTHAIDDTTTSATAVGYDMLYGAGLTVLGSPTYNLDLVTTPATPANLLPASCSLNQPLYVGLANAGSSQDGTLANPYISISEAMFKATSAQCVVVLPGEYVAPVAASSLISTPAVLSYESATSFPATPSNISSAFLPAISIASSGITIDGFTAQAVATLRYPTGGNILRIAPLYISSATTALVQNNSFSGYVAPGSVNSSSGTQIKGNFFGSFAIPSTTAGVITSPEIFTTAALEIKNSTNITLSNNTFFNNSIGTTNGTVSTWYPAIVGIQYSGVNLFNNRFTQNTTSSMVGIDQWAGSVGSGTRLTDEIRFVGNVFNSNIINGPLVHLFAASDMRFVNNTVASNVMNSNGTNNIDASGSNSAAVANGYFMYGVTNSSYVEINAHFEIHNNVFYNNMNTSKTVRPIFLETVGNVILDCLAIGSGAPVRNNWFDAVIGNNASSNTRPGECNAGGKITGSIDEPLSATNFFGTATDGVDPWRLRPTDPSITNLKSGINTGDDQALIDIFGDPAYKSLKDIRGGSRVEIGGNPNPGYVQLHVDVGAYELGTASAPIADPKPVNIDEDSTTSVVVTLTATGGYTQTFNITSQPSQYDTNPANACGGQPLLFTAPNIVTYCPPANFHTLYGPGGTDVPIVIGFSVEDTIFKPGLVDTDNITITINPIDDNPATQPTAPNFSVLSDYFTPISQQLSPAYTINNFSLIGSTNGVDYPFTYAFISQTVTTGDNANLLQASPSDPTTAEVLQDAFAAAGTNGGKLNINPVAGQSGFYKFTYSVTDLEGDSAIGNATIVILPTLAKEGIYDDASFNFAYNGNGWTPSYVAGAYNSTLHATSAASAYIEFPFTGTSVRFNLRGSTNVSSTLKLAFKVDLGNGGVVYQDYATTKATVTSLSCVDSLNPAVAPNGSSDVTNYSATGAAYTIICSGFPSGQVHSIRLTNNVAAAMTLDSAEVSAGIMTAGKSYQETSSNISYTGSWTQLANASTLGGTWTYTNASNASFSFNIDSTVGRIIFYRATYLAGVYGSMNVYLDANLSTPIATITSNSATLVYAQPYLLTIASPGNHTITVKNTGSTYITLDQITTLPAAQTLGVGTYQESYPDLTYNGVWTTQVNASALGGTWAYTNSPTASVSFKIDNTVSRITIYRTTYLSGVYGSMNVYLDTNLTTPIATISNVTAGLLFAQPYLINIPTLGNHTITIKNAGSTYSTLDQIVLAGPTQTLTATPGTYQESNANLTYSGIWTTQPNASALGGTWAYTNDSSASVSFKIDSSVSRMVIYTTKYLAGVYGTMNVYLDTNLTTPIATISTVGSALTFGQPTLINIPATGNHTITIKNVGSTYGNIDQITLMGAPQRLSIGSYQETDFNLTYTGTWTNQAVGGALGGTRSYTNQNEASISFKIDSNVERVVIYRSKYFAGVYGSMDVYLDTNQTPIANIPNTGSTFLLAQAYVLNIASPNDHTITIKNVGTTYSDIDQITLLGASTRLTGSDTGNNYQETYVDLTYSGTWTQQVLASALGGSRTYTNQNGAYVWFDIDSSVSRIILYRSTYLAGTYGSFNVYLDSLASQPIAVINNTSASALYAQPYLLTIQPPGDHRVYIKNVGTTYSDIDQITLLGPTQRLTTTPGIYQETNVNLTYSGTWTPQILAQALGGSRSYTNDPNGTVSFDIDGSVGRVLIYRSTYLAGVYGSMNIYLDNPTMSGAATAVMDNTSTSALYGQPFVLTIGTPGNHNITIRNGGSTYSDIDQITLLPPAASLTTTPGTYQETNVNLTYTGTWTSQNYASALGGSRSYTNQNGATVSFQIDGSVGRVVIYRTTYVAGVYGSFKVYIDDPNLQTPVATIDNTSATQLFGQAYILNIQTPAVHTITLQNVGSTYSDIDQITLLGPVQRLTATPGTYQETNTNLTYSGIWTSQVNSSALGGTWSYTNQNNASVSFDIDGSVSRIVIYRTTYVAGVYGTMQVLIDGSAVPESPLPFTSAGLAFGQPFFVNIASPGNHTIMLKNIGTTYSDIDQITLLGPASALSTAAIYEENDPAITFTGAWTSTQGAGPSGNAAYYTYAPNATVKFSVTGTAFSIYRTMVPGAGSYSISIDGSPQNLNDNAASLMWQQPIEFKNLTNTTHTVVITKTSPATDFIYFDAVRVIDPAAALTVGQYQNTYPGLTYTGAWTTSGASTNTTTTTNTLTFKFTGNGFGFITLNPTAGGTMTVSCKIGLGADVCADPTSTPANGGYAFYNLKQGTYDVIITYTGTGGLYIDRVFVLDTPTTTLQPGTYEDTNSAIVYSPADVWSNYPSTSYSGGAMKGTYQKGAVAQMRFNGSSLVLYQLAYTGASNNLNLCVLLTDAAGNPASVCSTFSQNSSAFIATAPIAFYGFGSGTHDIIIENRMQGSLLSIDKILVN